MPVILLDRLPLPNLQAYTAISVLLLSCSIYYAGKVTLQNPDWRANYTLHQDDPSDESLSEMQLVNGTEKSLSVFRSLADIVSFMIHEPLCMWTLINMAYCGLILLGHIIQNAVFGELRVSEQQHIKDKFWNFVFYKFIFIFGVVNVQHLDEVVLWVSWFSVLGFLHLLAQLCKDRFEYLSFSPTTSNRRHIRLMALLATILLFSWLMILICVFVGVRAGINIFGFMAAELFHDVHMLLWGNIFLSMASLVISMQIRYLYGQIRSRILRYKTYRKVVNYMNNHYHMASPEELATSAEDCAICWDKMESARKLPCEHYFHNACLLQWLEQDTSCPTCRQSLHVHDSLDPDSMQESAPAQDNQQRGSHHFFHFDGSRYVSWLPSLSVEVSHTQLLQTDQQPVRTSHIDSMARQVQQMFPDVPMSIIQDDLRSTRSLEQTVENILEERVSTSPLPPSFGNETASTEPQSLTAYEAEGTATDALSSSAPFQSRASQVKEEEEGKTVDDGPGQWAGRFSKCPEEREQILEMRKRQLLNRARQRYVSRKEDTAT